MGAWRALEDWLMEPEQEADIAPVHSEPPRPVARRFGLREAHAYGGLLLMGAGAGWAYPPAGLIVVGGVLLYIGIWRAR